MRREQFVKEFEHRLTNMYNTMKKKNADYANDDNPFGNFELVENMWLATLEEWIMVRMSDKMSRIANLLNREAQVKDEAVTDTLLDLANYSVILNIYISNKLKNKNEK